MRKVLTVLSLAAAASFAASGAQAAGYYYRHRPLHVHVYHTHNPAAPVDTTIGVAGGTAAGVGVAEASAGATAVGAALPATAAGAAAVGGVVGVGAVAAVDSVLQPCRGFHALFDLNHGACENGHYVGYGPRMSYNSGPIRHGRRVYER
ncbi:MAG: hypothetical protein ACREES_07725 [Stellaceae bacterium]